MSILVLNFCKNSFDKSKFELLYRNLKSLSKISELSKLLYFSLLSIIY
jgi:hypothetical protein